MIYWQWHPATYQYEITAAGAAVLGLPLGTAITEETLMLLRDGIIDAAQHRIQEATQQYIDGEAALTAWVLLLRAEIELVSTQQWLLATGGVEQFTPTEARLLTQHIQEQNRYLQGFAAAVQQGQLTAGQMLARAAMYAAMTVLLFEQGAAAARGATLPTYPGQQQCRANCRCHWRWVDAGDQWHVIWVLDPGAKHCPDCLGNAIQYSAANPYVVVKPILQRILT